MLIKRQNSHSLRLDVENRQLAAGAARGTTIRAIAARPTATTTIPATATTISVFGWCALPRPALPTVRIGVRDCIERTWGSPDLFSERQATASKNQPEPVTLVGSPKNWLALPLNFALCCEPSLPRIGMVERSPLFVSLKFSCQHSKVSPTIGRNICASLRGL